MNWEIEKIKWWQDIKTQLRNNTYKANPRAGYPIFACDTDRAIEYCNRQIASLQKELKTS